MTSALKDENGVSSKMAVLNTDTVQGTNLVRLALNGSNGGLKINTTATISFTMRSVSPKDENMVNCWLFQGSDGLTYPAVATSAGELLITTT